MSEAPHKTTAPKSHPVFSAPDERHYEHLVAIDNLDMSGRQFWRVLKAFPFCPTGRIAEVRNRIWLVPSTRTEDKLYMVDLRTFECVVEGTGEKCPDKLYNKKMRCVHVEAAQEKERRYVRDQRDNALIFPDVDRRLVAA